MGSSGSGSQSVQENPLPDYAQPMVEYYLTKSHALSMVAYTAYTGTTYAPQNANEVDGISAIATRAKAGHPIVSGAETLLQAILNDEKMNTNPTLANLFAARKDKMLHDFESQTLPGIHRAALLSGNWGSSGHHISQSKAAEDFIERLAAVAEEIFGGDYMDEREYQFTAAGQGLTYGLETAKDLDILRKAALYVREYTQGGYDDAYKQWKEVEVSKVKRLEILGNAIRALVGSQVTSTSPLYRPGTWSQVAAIAATGISMYASMYSGPKKTMLSSVPTLTSYAQGQGGQGPFLTSPSNPEQSFSQWGAEQIPQGEP